MDGSGYSIALIAGLLADLRATGDFDRLLAEAAAAGPAD